MWRKVRVGLTGPRISYRSETQAKHRKIIAPQRYTGIVRLQKISKMFLWRDESREREIGSLLVALQGIIIHCLQDRREEGAEAVKEDVLHELYEATEVEFWISKLDPYFFPRELLGTWISSVSKASKFRSGVAYQGISVSGHCDTSSSLVPRC
jgi:hypothetical protein